MRSEANDARSEELELQRRKLAGVQARKAEVEQLRKRQQEVSARENGGLGDRAQFGDGLELIGCPVKVEGVLQRFTASRKYNRNPRDRPYHAHSTAI